MDCAARNLGFHAPGARPVSRDLVTVNLKPIRDFTSDYNLVAVCGDAIADQKGDLGV
jgi:hypothetical protein